MAVVPRAVFLNRTYISHEHQQQLCVHNDRRRVCDRLTGRLRNPVVHREGSLSITFLFREYPSLSPADIIHETLVNLHRLYEAEGYQVHTVSDTEGFTVTLDWRELCPTLHRAAT